MDKEFRRVEICRTTSETCIEANLNLDGSGISNINTNIGFFDHMLTLLTKHGLLDLDLKTKGDLYVDPHHTVEDTGIVLGRCIKKALGNKEGIKRYGSAYVPMDETLAFVSLDLSGRPYIVFDAKFTVDRLGELDTELIEEFFRALAFNAGITLHIKILYGKNNHHMIEGLFKAFARALKEAIEYDDRIKGVMSTKGIL
ncbi:imidazoleglycerol-phosphate dehydratase [Clostridium acetireducens DSM 10703]|uniref:Imidazoleglycerol-phosphate dehydratase n=1 Tax=Clostridium acetireducens DSM 10703 TaxID=1121290 RepID=A0A1E8EX58_9CLOT|nr:imidazoleglycerol-phosphate dehydratase HisB [Clostridium acetireducens]OFI05360.1 imidazoleglycerol-phosphate dehydratase [Clostridium acetireducens DSM 10703]